MIKLKRLILQQMMRRSKTAKLMTIQRKKRMMIRKKLNTELMKMTERK